jgi:6-phosphogluconolactonase
LVRVFRDLESMSRAGADLVAEAGREAVRARGRFDLVLAGGRTPLRTYELLAELISPDAPLRAHTHLYWGDERLVTHDDPRSNYASGLASLIAPARVSESNVHPIPTGPAAPEECARDYEAVFPARPDVFLLGMGADGHTASLFPGSPALDETRRRFVAVEGPVEPRLRITATPRSLLSAGRTVVLVSGEGKLGALVRVFRRGESVRSTPARIVAAATWLVDRAAAGGVLELDVDDRPEWRAEDEG